MTFTTRPEPESTAPAVAATEGLRSWLYAPGSHPERIAKALASGADAVVIDLEDAVPPEDKDQARESAVRAAEEHHADPGGPRLWVRMNDPVGRWGEDDLEAVTNAPFDGIRVPHAESPSVVRQVALRAGRPLQLLLESAAGLIKAHELASADPLVAGVGLGEADLAADLQVLSDEGLAWARGWVVAAARAAGLASPIQSVWTNVADIEGLRTSTLHASRTGFWGRSVVHPRQIPVVHGVFAVSAQAVAESVATVQTFEQARLRGESAVLDELGRLLDPAVVARARVVLQRHEHSIRESGDPPGSSGGTANPGQEHQ